MCVKDAEHLFQGRCIALHFIILFWSIHQLIEILLDMCVFCSIYDFHHLWLPRERTRVKWIHFIWHQYFSLLESCFLYSSPQKNGERESLFPVNIAWIIWGEHFMWAFSGGHFLEKRFKTTPKILATNFTIFWNCTKKQ